MKITQQTETILTLETTIVELRKKSLLFAMIGLGFLCASIYFILSSNEDYTLTCYQHNTETVNCVTTMTGLLGQSETTIEQVRDVQIDISPRNTQQPVILYQAALINAEGEVPLSYTESSDREIAQQTVDAIRYLVQNPDGSALEFSDSLEFSLSILLAMCLVPVGGAFLFRAIFGKNPILAVFDKEAGNLSITHRSLINQSHTEIIPIHEVQEATVKVYEGRKRQTQYETRLLFATRKPIVLLSSDEEATLAEEINRFLAT
ncbi:MAG: hypothetical protein AAF639_43440 [Chloroflexota bacterium]